MRKPHGYWQDPVNVVAEARKAMQEQGWDTLPGASTLKKHRYSGLTNAANYHGGMFGLRGLLGQKSLKRPRNFWKDPLNVVSEAQRVMREQGWDVLPSKRVLCEHGYSSLPNVAAKYHGGMSGLRELLGQRGFSRLKKEHGYMSKMKKPKGYWKDPDNIVAAVRSMFEKEGWEILPSQGVLCKRGYSSIVGGATHHGGMNGLRGLLGQEMLIRPYGFWKDPVNVVAEAKKAMEQHGWDTLPGDKTLRKHGSGSICNAATYHGGMSGLRKLIAERLQQPTEQEQLEVLVGGYDE